MTKTDKPELETREVVYLGRRMLRDGKLGDAFALLTEVNAKEPETLERLSSVFKAERTRKTVGGIYAMQVIVNDDHINTRTASAQYVRQHPDNEKLIIWRAADTTANTDKRRADMEKRHQKEGGLAEEMETLKRIYCALPFGDRRAFDIMVLDELRNAPLARRAKS